jgi:Tol biopolymer transport system component
MTSRRGGVRVRVGASEGDPAEAGGGRASRSQRRLGAVVVAFIVSLSGLAFASRVFLAMPQRSDPSVALGDGHIAIAVGRDQDVMLIDPATGNSTLLVDRRGAHESNTNRLEMDWSPDGSMLAYTDIRDSGLQGLFVLDVASGGIVDLSEGLPHADDPTWSPDGSRIAFGGFDGTSGYEIYVAAYDGSDRVRVTDHANDGVSGGLVPAWSPDGQRIAFAFNRYDATTEVETNGIGIVRTSGNGETDVTDGLDTQPAWSPDGAALVFARHAPEVELYVVRADGSEERRISPDGAMLTSSSASAWSPDGTRLLFSYEDRDSPSYSMIVMDASTGKVETMPDETFVGFPVWSPDGTRIAFVRDDDRQGPSAASLWVTSPDLTGETELIDGLEYVSDIAWQPITGTTSEPSPSDDSSTIPEPLPPADPEITATIPLGRNGGVSAILYADASVWVTAHAVDGGGGVDRSMLFRIDGSSNDIAATIPLRGGPTFVSGGGGLAYGFGSVWVAGYDYVGGSMRAVLHRVDPVSNSVTASIPLNGSHGADVAVDQTGVWVAYFGDEHAGVSRVDPATEHVVAEVALPSEYVRRITAAAGGVVATELEWHGHQGPCMIMTALDPVTATIIAREPVYPPCGGVQLFAWNDEIWASGATLQRVDPTTARLLGDGIPFEPYRSPRSFVLGMGREVWFGAYPGGNGARLDRLARLDATTGSIEYFIEAGGMDAVFAADTRTIWIMEYGGSVTRVDLNDG